MRSTPSHLACLALAGLICAPTAQASVPTPAAANAPGVQVATCASLNGSGNGLSISGAIDSGLLAAGTQCTGNTAGGPAAQVSSQAQSDNGQAVANAQAQASLGVLKLSSSLSTPGGGTVRFPIGVAQASFVASMTPNIPGLNGQAAYLLVPLHVSGSLHASGNAGAAAFSVAVLKNDFTLSTSNPGYVVGTGNQVSTDRQVPTWRVASYPVPGPLVDDASVDETVVFSVPVTIGTPFDLSVVAMSVAGTRSQTGGGNAASDFAHTVQWLGATKVRMANGSLVDVTLTDNTSGVNWGQAAPVPVPVPVPEPAAMALAAAGLLVVSMRKPRLALL
jgi:hypothetical protein